MFWKKNLSKLPSRTWQDTYNCENREQFCFSVETCCICAVFAFGLGQLNRGNLFAFIGSNKDTVLLTILSFTNALNCFLPISFTSFAVHITLSPTISRLSSTSRSQQMDYPILQLLDTVDRLCFLNFFCTLLVASWLVLNFLFAKF